DNHVLDKDYNPLEIHFPYEMIMHFEDLSASQLLGVCNAANYLNYPYLLELCCKIIANEISDNPNSELLDYVRGTKKVANEQANEIQAGFEYLDNDFEM
ncbi:hypothetical protein ENBRE01_3440, partial [Enteropsectra breve]